MESQAIFKAKAQAKIFQTESPPRRATWFERHEWDGGRGGGGALNHAFKHRRFKISGQMGTGKRALLKVHLLETAGAPPPGGRLSGGVSLAAMKVLQGHEMAWHGGKAIAVDARGIAHALVVRFERDPAGHQTTLLLQPCVSPGRSSSLSPSTSPLPFFRGCFTLI